MNKVVLKRLGDLITLKRGYDLPEKNRTEGPYPVISSAGISGYHNEYKVDGQGVVTGRYGTLGVMYFVEGKYWPHNTALYVQNFKGNDPKYIYYLLSCLGRIRTSDKSAVPGVNRNELHEMAIPAIEDRKLQVATRQVLEAIDEKIVLNNRINAELEAMAKLIYDYWFVQFDFPDAKGKPYKSAGGKMVYNEALKREIPKGWVLRELGTLGEFKNGVNYDPSKPGDVACPIINVRNISATSYFLNSNDLDTVYLKKNEAEKYYVNKGDIIIARSGIPGATRLFYEFKPNTIFCGFAIRYKLNNLLRKNQIFFFMKSVEESIKNGSGGTILKNVNQGTLKELTFVTPECDGMLKEFNKIVDPLFGKIALIQKEDQKLSELRDWLLPMLMNGQVTVKGTHHCKKGKLKHGSSIL